jgi:CRISPR-associated protein Csy1
MTSAADPAAPAWRAFHSGDHARAQQLALDCLRRLPASLSALSVLANASNALGDYPRALAALDSLHKALPHDAAIRKALAMACNNRGSQLFAGGDLDGAGSQYARATALDDALALAWANLAACAVQRRRHDLAARCFRRLLELDKDNIEAALGLSRALRASGDANEADAILESIAARSTTPDLRVALEFARIGATDRAQALFESIEGTLDPDAYLQMAAMQLVSDDITGARRNFAHVAANPLADERMRFRAERDAAFAQPAIFSDAAAIATARDDYRARLDQLCGNWPAERLARGGVGIGDLSHVRSALAYQGADDLAPANRYGDWLAQSAGQLAGVGEVPARTGPIRRIGLVCARWTQGTIAAYFGEWPAALRDAGFEVHLYTPATRAEDEVSRAIAASANHAMRLPPDISAAVRVVRDAKLDLLIYPEVGLDGVTEVLAALRLAPRQWAAWGHPVTTGLPHIDRFISVATMEPDGAQRDYRETLLQLPGLGTRFQRAPAAAPGSRAQFGLPKHGALYLVPHSALKLHPDIDALFAAILQRDAHGHLVFFVDEMPAHTQRLRQRIEHRFATAKIDRAADRLLWLPRQSISDFRSLLTCVDVVLDALHFSGGATSLEVLSQNTPIVTVEGRYMRGRQTAAMLRMLDLPDLICADTAAAAARAVAIALDGEARRHIRAQLAERTSILFEQTAPLQALCAFVKDAEQGL